MRRICHTEVEWHRQLQLFIQHQLSWPITTVHAAPEVTLSKTATHAIRRMHSNKFTTC